MNYYKRHLGDYAKDTKTISVYEHGVYTVVLDYYYSEEGPVSDEDVEALCRPQNAKERASVDKVMRRYFKRDGSVWRHSYADRVIAVAQEKSAKAAESADKRWQCERNANASETQMPTQSDGNASHKPLAISQEPRKTARKRATPLPEGFGISERVKAWAAEKGHGRLTERLEHFLSYAKRKAPTYADWDEALMTAIREDWAKLGAAQAPAPPPKHKCAKCAEPTGGFPYKGALYCLNHYNDLMQADADAKMVRMRQEQEQARRIA